MIRVAFDLRDPLRSGIARVARNLAREFARQSDGRFEVVLAGPLQQLDQLDASQWSSDVAALVPWDAPRYSPRAELAWLKVRREVRDAIWFFPHWDVPWLLPPRRFVAAVHDVAHLSLDMGRSKRALARRWIHRTTSRARRIVTGSRFTQRELTTRWPELADKIEILRYGVDERFFVQPPPLPQSVLEALPAGQNPMMLSVGNLKKYKNLIQGPEVLSRIRGLHWVVVGEYFEDWLEVVQRADELGVRDRMVVLGRQPDEVLHALYDRASCLFFPSLHEGFGLPILEAFACGTPVVAGDAPATLETIGDAGIVCRGDDPIAFSRGVEEAIVGGDRDIEKRRARARLYSWKAAAERLVEIMLETHRQPSQ